MVHSTLLDSFNPFATHPFTNNSGIPPQPPSPSAYPLPVPSLETSRYENNQFSQMSTSPSSISSSSSMESTIPEPNLSSRIHHPQPRRYHAPLRSPTSPTSPSQVFVRFRKDASSPDLILKKKSPTSTSGGSMVISTK